MDDRLGSALTTVARDAYPFEENPGSTTRLMGCNELQHQIYGRIQHLRRHEDWTLTSFLEGLRQRAALYGIPAGLQWALHQSLRYLE
jgi:hypothetical protein